MCSAKPACLLYPQKRTLSATRYCPLWANSGHDATHSITSSASASSAGGIRDPERLCRLQVDDQLELGCLHHRKVGGLFAFENSTGIQAGLPIHVADARTIAHKAARHSVLAQSIDRRYRVVCRQRNDSMALTFENWIGGHKKCVYPFSRQRLKGSIKIQPFCRLLALSLAIRACARCAPRLLPRPRWPAWSSS